MLVAAALLADPLETVLPDGGTPDEYEWKIFPVVAYNSDIGLELGVFGVVNQLGPPGLPYHWSLSGQAAASLKGRPGGGLEIPVHDDSLTLDWRSLDRRWQLVGAFWFWQAANAGFYGLGNASLPEGDPSATSIRPTQYLRSELVGSGSVGYRLLPALRLRGGLAVQRIAPGIYPGSTLALTPASEPLMLGLATHVSAIAAVAVEVDTRDRELAPSHGVFLEAGARGSLGPLTGNDLTFGGLTVHLRGYHDVWPGRVVLAARVLLDAVFGHPPLHELSRSGGFSEVWMLGGSDGIRGIPEGRYQGRIKLAASLEARVHVARFVVLQQRFEFGVVAFADAGRVWADWTPRGDLDGRGLGIHPAFGGGLRLRWGETVLIRFDIGYAPPPAGTVADPLGVYFNMGHVF